MNEFEHMLARMVGLDHTKEVIDLWYEVTYLRFVLTYAVESNPDMKKIVNEELYNRARKDAQEYIKSKFPKMGIEFKSMEESEKISDSTDQNN